MNKKKAVMVVVSIAAVAVGIAMTVGISSFNQRARNKVIFHAMNPYKDIAQYALKDRSPNITDSLAKIKSALAKLKSILPQQIFTELQSKSAAISAAVSNNDLNSAAALALESYRLLIDQLDTFWQKNRKEVALLDYTGIRTQLLLIQSEPDWKEMNKTANEADISWSAISGHVEDRRLKDSLGTAIGGLQDAAALKDASMAAFAAKMELDIVDLLEKHFREED